jgi:hypothetical protein
MTPPTKSAMSPRQRRVVPSAVSEGTDPVATPKDPTPEPPVPVSEVVSEAVSDAAERLHRGYTSAEAPASQRRLAAVSAWSLVLVVGGIVVGLRALLTKLDGSGTGLAAAVPTLTVIGGLTGLGMTIAAFLTIGGRRTPWVLLGAASAILFTLMVLTASA